MPPGYRKKVNLIFLAILAAVILIKMMRRITKAVVATPSTIISGHGMRLSSLNKSFTIITT